MISVPRVHFCEVERRLVKYVWMTTTIKFDRLRLKRAKTTTRYFVSLSLYSISIFRCKSFSSSSSRSTFSGVASDKTSEILSR